MKKRIEHTNDLDVTPSDVENLCEDQFEQETSISVTDHVLERRDRM